MGAGRMHPQHRARAAVRFKPAVPLRSTAVERGHRVADTRAVAALTWLAFERHQAGHAFITNNFLLNAHWNQVETPQGGKLLLNSGPALLLGLLGAL